MFFMVLKFSSRYTVVFHFYFFWEGGVVENTVKWKFDAKEQSLSMLRNLKDSLISPPLISTHCPRLCKTCLTSLVILLL